MSAEAIPTASTPTGTEWAVSSLARPLRLWPPAGGRRRVHSAHATEIRRWRGAVRSESKRLAGARCVSFSCSGGPALPALLLLRLGFLRARAPEHPREHAPPSSRFYLVLLPVAAILEQFPRRLVKRPAQVPQLLSHHPSRRRPSPRRSSRGRPPSRRCVRPLHVLGRARHTAGGLPPPRHLCGDAP